MLGVISNYEDKEDCVLDSAHLFRIKRVLKPKQNLYQIKDTRTVSMFAAA